MSQPTFKELEHDGWTARAHAYDDWLAPVTRQAIDPPTLETATAQFRLQGI